VKRINAQFGSSEVWTAVADGPLLNATVTATQQFTGFDQSLTVVAFVGASGVGATGGTSAPTGIASVSLTTTDAGSLVYAVGNDSTRATPRTLGSSQAMTHQWVDFGASNTFWVQSLNAPIANTGTTATLNDLAPANDRWNYAAVEILAAGAAAPANVTVPDVVGATEAAATIEITAASLTVGAVTTASSTTVPSGSVISQTPASGTQVAVDSAVSLVVSSGLPLVATPNLVGLTQAAASTAIAGAGLNNGVVTTVSSTTVPDGVVISQNPAAASNVPVGSAIDFVVSSGPPLAIDTTMFSDGVGTRVTAPFDTATPGELLVAFASSEGPNTTARQTLTVSGAGLTWTLVARANTQWGTSEIWTATAPVALSNATVTATQTISGGFSGSLTVVAFTGGAVGSSVAGGGNNTPPGISVATTTTGSLIYGVGNDADRDITRTVGLSQALVHQFLDPTLRATFWVQTRTTPTASGGSIFPLNDTAPTNNRWNLAAIEIVPR
jgi:hypothetical protein